MQYEQASIVARQTAHIAIEMWCHTIVARLDGIYFLTARQAAHRALEVWYQDSFYTAMAVLPHLQRKENDMRMDRCPLWQGRQNQGDAYVMLRMVPNGTETPVRITLQYGVQLRTEVLAANDYMFYGSGTGGLTYRSLHFQIRKHLGLKGKVSLRLCADRPWYQYMTNECMVPQSRAIECSDMQCRYLIGTTLLGYAYVHLQE